MNLICQFTPADIFLAISGNEPLINEYNVNWEF